MPLKYRRRPTKSSPDASSTFGPDDNDAVFPRYFAELRGTTSTLRIAADLTGARPDQEVTSA